jgi:hypothetical protein
LTDIPDPQGGSPSVPQERTLVDVLQEALDQADHAEQASAAANRQLWDELATLPPGEEVMLRDADGRGLWLITADDARFLPVITGDLYAGTYPPRESVPADWPWDILAAALVCWTVAVTVLLAWWNPPTPWAVLCYPAAAGAVAALSFGTVRTFNHLTKAGPRR